jgi:hypothetical protein
MIIAATNLSMVVKEEHILWANTMLAAAERKMPKALGEFGKSRYAEVSNEILEWMNRKSKPVTITEIFKAVSRSISKMPELLEVISNLAKADRIQVREVAGKTGYMTKHTEAAKWKECFLDLNWLTPEENI